MTRFIIVLSLVVAPVIVCSAFSSRAENRYACEVALAQASGAAVAEEGYVCLVGATDETMLRDIARMPIRTGMSFGKTITHGETVPLASMSDREALSISGSHKTLACAGKRPLDASCEVERDEWVRTTAKPR
jgi:hypothetical protein